jgi:RND family efflux transporter MFP subunit
MSDNHPQPEPSPTTKPRGAGRAVAVTLALLVAGGGGAYAWKARQAAEHGAPAPAAAAGTAEAPAPKVGVAAVEQRTLTDHRELLGRVEAIEAVEVRPRVSGHIEEVRLQAGQLVSAGDVLFVIDPRWYQAQFDGAKATAERAKARLHQAELDAARSEKLLAARTISVEEADNRATRLEEARADLLATEAALATARLDLEHTEVRAPISGRVSRALVTEGNLISGTPGAASVLTTILSVGQAYVYADVDETTLLAYNRVAKTGGLATEGGRVPVDMELSDEDGFPRQGYVESADNRMDAGTGTLVLRMVFPDPEGLLVPGLSARVRLPISAPQPTMLVSNRAIGTDQAQKFVFTVDAANTVAYRAVKLGPVVEGRRVIRDGLKPGERIVVNGLQRVRPGIIVAPENESGDALALK